MAALNIEPVTRAHHDIVVTARGNPDTTFTFRSVRSLTQGETVSLDIDPRVVITYKGEDGTLSTSRPTKFSYDHLAGVLAAASNHAFLDLEEEGRSNKDMSSREKAVMLTSKVQEQLGDMLSRFSMSIPDTLCGIREVLVWDDPAASQARLRRAAVSDSFKTPTLDHVIFGVSRMNQQEISWIHQALSQEEGWGQVQVRSPELQDMNDDEHSYVDNSLVVVRGTIYDGQEELLEEDRDGGEGQRVIERGCIIRIPQNLAPIGAPSIPTPSLPLRSDLQLASQRPSQISRASAQASSEPFSEVLSEWSAQMTPTQSSEDEESNLIEVFMALNVDE